MATKKQPRSINYGPDTALIQGEGMLYDSRTAAESAGIGSFTKNFATTFALGLEEQKKFEAEMNGYVDRLKSVDNIFKIDESNRPAVTQFVNSKTDEYAKLADSYIKGGKKDRALKNKMEEIEYSLANLNNQLDVLQQDRVGFLEAFESGDLVTSGKSYNSNLYGKILTDKQPFTISGMGDLDFNVDGKDYKYSDVAGKWNVKNNIAENYLLKLDENIINNAAKGGKFDEFGIKNNIKSTFKSTGNDGIQVMAETDMTGDDEFVLANGQKAGNLSFEYMWGNGLLDKKYYQGRKSGDTKWMFENENVEELNDLLSTYYTDVMRSRYTPNYVAPKQKQTSAGNYFIDGREISAQTFNNSLVPFIKNLQTPVEGKVYKNPISGVRFKYKGDAYYIVTGNNKVDEEMPMTFEQVGDYEGWSAYLTPGKVETVNKKNFGAGSK